MKPIPRNAAADHPIGFSRPKSRERIETDLAGIARQAHLGFSRPKSRERIETWLLAALVLFCIGFLPAEKPGAD